MTATSVIYTYVLYLNMHIWIKGHLLLHIMITVNLGIFIVEKPRAQNISVRMIEVYVLNNVPKEVDISFPFSLNEMCSIPFTVPFYVLWAQATN